MLGGAQQLYAETSGDLETEVDTITGTVPTPPPAQTGVLNQSTDGKNWTADFTRVPPAQATKLQMQRICTKETDEVNEAIRLRRKKGPWITIATANQDAAGHVVFPALASPYPYRVKHKYRATSGTARRTSVRRSDVRPRPGDA